MAPPSRAPSTNPEHRLALEAARDFRNGKQRLQRGDLTKEDANAAAGEPLAIKAKAYAMPGVTVDGGDPLAVHAIVGEAVDRARYGAGPTLIESKVYRLSAHGNIIAPPEFSLHYPEHEAIAVFGKREEYEAALRGDPVPRFRATLISAGLLTRRRPMKSRRRCKPKCAPRSHSV